MLAQRGHSESGEVELPWILLGEPGGYQNDIVVWKNPEDLSDLLVPRVSAMFRLSPGFRNGGATDYLQSKRYTQFFVFISHTLKPPDRSLVEHVYSLLKARHITPFEYHQVIKPGIDWREALNDALRKTTHFVALVSPDYEQSPACTHEMEEALRRGNEITILPFMFGGRDKPHAKLTQMHNMLLSGPDPQANAEIIVRQVVEVLESALARSNQE